MRIANYSVPFIVSMIQNIEKVEEKRYYKADLSASDMLLDLELIMGRAKLTDKQQYILDNYWVGGFTQQEVAEQLGVSQQMIEKFTRAIKKKIYKVLIDMNEVVA